MRRSRLAAVCVLISALLLGGCGATAATEQHTVALVAKSTQTEFWLSVFAGAEAAAEAALRLAPDDKRLRHNLEIIRQRGATA